MLERRTLSDRRAESPHADLIRAARDAGVLTGLRLGLDVVGRARSVGDAYLQLSELIRELQTPVPDGVAPESP